MLSVIIEVVVLIADGYVLHCFSLLFLLILPLHAVLEVLGDLLVHDGLLLASDDVEVGVVLLDDVLGSHVPIDLFTLVELL